MKHKHLVVIGRIPDEENIFQHYDNMTDDDAVTQFEKDMVSTHIANCCETQEQIKEVIDQGVYVDCIMTSESPIKVDWRC